MKCSICGLPIPVKHGWAEGNNAEPINDGRCCDDCNNIYVIPARLGYKVTPPLAAYRYTKAKRDKTHQAKTTALLSRASLYTPTRGRILSNLGDQWLTQDCND